MFATLHEHLLECKEELESAISERKATIKRSKKWKVMKLATECEEILNEQEFELDEVNTLINRYKRFL